MIRAPDALIADLTAEAHSRQVRPGVYINAVREVDKARLESAGSRMAMQGGV